MVWGKRLAREGIFYKTHSLLMKLRLRRARGIGRRFERIACHGFALPHRELWPLPVKFFYAHFVVLTRLRVEYFHIHGISAINWKRASPNVHQTPAFCTPPKASSKHPGIHRVIFPRIATSGKGRDDGQRDEA